MPTSSRTVVGVAEAIVEYEEAYRRFLRDTPALVAFLVERCGNVYDTEPSNVHDTDYLQPHTSMNHYQDISVRRVIAEWSTTPRGPTSPTPNRVTPICSTWPRAPS